jgi:hypothetical protein
MNSINLAPILSVLKSAQADIEDLITVAGVDPYSQAEMLAENYEVQWNTLGYLHIDLVGEVIELGRGGQNVMFL